VGGGCWVALSIDRVVAVQADRAILGSGDKVAAISVE